MQKQTKPPRPPPKQEQMLVLPIALRDNIVEHLRQFPMKDMELVVTALRALQPVKADEFPKLAPATEKKASRRVIVT